MLIRKRIPIVLALAAAGLALMATALTASARPLAVPRDYPSDEAPCNTTLQACINGSAAGDQINIDTGIYTTSVLLNKSVSLVGAGAGATILRAPAGARVLLVTGAVTSSAVIADLTIEGGVLAAGNGAGVLVQAGAQPTLRDLVIQNNIVQAATAVGAGLYTESSLTLTNVTFFWNVAFAGRGGGLGGGPSAHINLINASFDINGADQGGGAIFANSASITGSTFTENIAGFTGHGGAAYLTGTVAITNSTFTTNEAHEHGGAVYAGGNASLNGGTFDGNVSSHERGGALYTGGSLVVNGTVITGNRSLDSGGALFVTGATTINDALIANNSSSGGAGAGLRAVGTVNINNTQFISNTSYNQGGGLRANGVLVVTDTDFISNTTTNNAGGGLDAVSNATITGGSFISNSTATDGGGARVLGTLVLSGTVFEGNVAARDGGGLDVITATVQNALFAQNQALVGNGGGLAASSSLSVTRTIFSQNAVLSGTVVSNKGSGGGIYGDGVVTSTDNVFIENYAHRLGGGMDADDLVSVWDQFRGNVTGPQGSGGGLFVAGLFDVDGGLFYTNTASTGGGLGVSAASTGPIYNSLFARNTVSATFIGGSAIWLESMLGVTLQHNTFAGPFHDGSATIQIEGIGDHLILNNIFVDASIGLSHAGTGIVTEDYSIFFNVPVPRDPSVPLGAQTITGDPLFVNPAGHDFHLSAGSPAIDSADFFIGLDHDFEGQPRPIGGGWDRGFDEVLLRVFLPLVVRQ